MVVVVEEKTVKIDKENDAQKRSEGCKELFNICVSAITL